MPSPEKRRIELHLHKPRWALYAGVRPTLVIDGVGQPTQWGHGTWQVPATESITIGIFLFNRLWRFGQAEVTLDPTHTGMNYRAPLLPFLAGSAHTVAPR